MPKLPRPRNTSMVCAVVIAGSVVLAACGGGDPSTSETRGTEASGGSSVAQTEDSGIDESAVDAVECGTQVPFDAANFVDPTLDTNPYHPLKPGIQWVRGGSTLVGEREVPHEVISTMTDVIREIDGVPTIAMLDESTNSGEVSQVGMDYLALDRDGNVWILGGYTEDYEGGQFTNIDSAFLGADGGQVVGILAPADVTMETPPWCIGGPAEENPSVGEPVEIGASDCVEFGCYDDVRVVQEGEAGAPDNENKYYAPGVGVIDNVPLDASLHQDRFELRNFVELGSDGLAEAAQTVLDLEAHASDVAADVYGDVPVATRASDG